MKRDSRTFLWDVAHATSLIHEFVRDKTFPEYDGHAMVRSAVERQFEVIGEALNQLSKTDPSLAKRVPHLSRIIAFRNLLIHSYATVDNAQVWATVQESLPELQETVSRLLEQLPPP